MLRTNEFVKTRKALKDSLYGSRYPLGRIAHRPDMRQTIRLCEVSSDIGTEQERLRVIKEKGNIILFLISC